MGRSLLTRSLCISGHRRHTESTNDSRRVRACCIKSARIGGAVSQASTHSLGLWEAEAQFIDSLAAKSPLTQGTYATALRRLDEYLSELKRKPAEVATGDINETILVDFQTW